MCMNVCIMTYIIYCIKYISIIVYLLIKYRVIIQFCNFVCRQLETLETTVANDMKLILSILKQQQNGEKSSDSLTDSKDVSFSLLINYMKSLINK